MKHKKLNVLEVVCLIGVTSCADNVKDNHDDEKNEDTIETDFINAAQNGDLKRLEYFLENRPLQIGLLTKDEAFFSAIRCGNQDSVNFFLQRNTISNGVIGIGLRVAAIEGDLNIVSILLDKITELQYNFGYYLGWGYFYALKNKKIEVAEHIKNFMTPENIKEFDTKYLRHSINLQNFETNNLDEGVLQESAD